MNENISESDLPSIKLYNELKDIIEYSTFHNFQKGKTTNTQIVEWITRFKSNIETYLLNPYKDFSLNDDKCCRYFYYLSHDIMQKLFLLSSDIWKINEWKQEIQNFRDKYFRTDSNFKCNKTYRYNNKEGKILDDFCVDSNFIKDKIDEIQKSDKCESIIHNMSSRKNELAEIFEREQKKERYTKFNATCSVEYFESIYPSISCIPTDKHLLAPGSVREPVHHADGETLQGTPVDQSLFPPGEMRHQIHESLIRQGENGENKVIGLVSLPVIGIVVISFLMYKFTNLGDKFQTYFRKNRSIIINHNDEITNEMLVNTPNFEDAYSENIPYNLLYQTV
ncbi:PIR protein [Plasmodium ovale]|uniref:PIR protein n=1 Tax=Plasmodium ovale TaxID=36330 RepID=A0A1D3JFC5_PLAOA|nr:PIR protein [Plasmodium ovale]